MVQKLIDITGNTYGYLKVLGFSHMGERRRSYWRCECLKCGNTVTVRKDSFVYPYSKVKSCGCWHIEESRNRASNAQRDSHGRFKK